MRWLLVLALACCAACTVQVGKPDITIDCVEVDFPNEHVLYCDGGAKPLPSPSDSGEDHG